MRKLSSVLFAITTILAGCFLSYCGVYSLKSQHSWSKWGEIYGPAAVFGGALYLAGGVFLVGLGLRGLSGKP